MAHVLAYLGLLGWAFGPALAFEWWASRVQRRALRRVTVELLRRVEALPQVPGKPKQ